MKITKTKIENKYIKIKHNYTIETVPYEDTLKGRDKRLFLHYHRKIFINYMKAEGEYQYNYRDIMRYRTRPRLKNSIYKKVKT